MRLHLILPPVEQEVKEVHCPYCQSKWLKVHEVVGKRVRDTVLMQVELRRYRCLRCRRTFRGYPKGVGRRQMTARLRGLGVLLYLLGLSYGAVALAMKAFGYRMSKTSVYLAVQEAAQHVPGMRRTAVFAGIRTAAVGADVTCVRCKGRWLPLGLISDPLRGLVLSVDALSAEDAAHLQAWVAPAAQAVGAEVLVTDDADAFKHVADGLGLRHQVCKKHVLENTRALVEELLPLVRQDADGSLRALGISPEQAEADLRTLLRLVEERRPEEVARLEGLFQAYHAARAPGAGEKASLAYRLRNLFLDRWQLWPRLTLYRHWQGKNGERLDGTNNASERGIGWYIKERYRTMRGYKRTTSAVNVSRLLAWAGNYLAAGGANLATLLA
jgi:transposase-like protein